MRPDSALSSGDTCERCTRGQRNLTPNILFNLEGLTLQTGIVVHIQTFTGQEPDKDKDVLHRKRECRFSTMFLLGHLKHKTQHLCICWDLISGTHPSRIDTPLLSVLIRCGFGILVRVAGRDRKTKSCTPSREFPASYKLPHPQPFDLFTPHPL